MIHEGLEDNISNFSFSPLFDRAGTHITIRQIASKKTPKRITARGRALLQDAVEILERRAAPLPRPVVLAREERLAGGRDELDVRPQLGHVDGVPVVRVDVDLVDCEVRFADPVRAVYEELGRREILDETREVAHPGHWHVEVARYGTFQLVS